MTPRQHQDLMLFICGLIIALAIAGLVIVGAP